MNTMSIMGKRGTEFYRLRWRVLERDDFTCQYCGQSAPSVVLGVDHIIPVSKGGSDDMSNLRTACWSCNRGKGDWLKIHQARSRGRGERPGRPPTIGPRILAYLDERGPSTGTMISKGIGVERSNVSKFLTTSDKIVVSWTSGREVFYDIADRED